MATHTEETRTSTRMSNQELAAIQAAWSRLSVNVDPSLLAPLLRDAGELTEEEALEFTSQEGDIEVDLATRTARISHPCTAFLVRVMERCSFTTFLGALYRCPGHERLASDLRQALETHSLAPQQVARAPVRATCLYRGRHRQMRLYLRLRRMHLTDNYAGFAAFVQDNKEALRQAFDRPHRLDEETFQLRVDLAFTAIEKQASKLQVESGAALRQEAIWENLRFLIPRTSSPRHAQAMYWARRVAADADGGRPVEQCLGDLEVALVQSASLAPCLELAVLHRWHLILLTRVYTRQPSAYVRDRILESARLAMHHFREEPNCSGEDKEENFLLVNQRLAFFLLGLDVKGTDMPGCHVSQEDMRRAEEQLRAGAEYRIFRDLRRRMFDELAWCVLLQRQGHLHDARVRGREALRLAVEGKFPKEREAIRQRLYDLASGSIHQSSPQLH